MSSNSDGAAAPAAVPAAGDAAALKAAANGRFAAGRYEEALKLYGKAIEACEQSGCADGLHILYGNRQGQPLVGKGAPSCPYVAPLQAVLCILQSLLVLCF